MHPGVFRRQRDAIFCPSTIAPRFVAAVVIDCVCPKHNPTRQSTLCQIGHLVGKSQSEVTMPDSREVRRICGFFDERYQHAFLLIMGDVLGSILHQSLQGRLERVPAVRARRLGTLVPPRVPDLERARNRAPS